MRRSKPFLLILFGVSIMVAFAVTSASAQFRAGIQGVVTDTNGATLSGATITLTNKETIKPRPRPPATRVFTASPALHPASIR
jgi:hypothetical protein